MSRFMGHYASGQICAVFLRGDRQDYEEVRLLNALEGCCAYLIIGISDGRRHGQLVDVPYYTAVSRDVVPIHIRKSGMTWLTVTEKATGEPLNGNAKREYQARLQREAFETAQFEQEPEEIDTTPFAYRLPQTEYEAAE